MAEGKGYSLTKAFAYLTKISSEKPIQVKEITAVVKTLDRKELFLDIGAGTGDTFFPVAKYFKRSIAIEPGERMFKIMQERSKKYKTGFELIKINWQDFYDKNKDKYAGKFDLIAGIHIAYFFPDLKEAISQMLEFLNPKGRLVFICAYGENQEKDFVHYLKSKIIGSRFVPNPIFSKLKVLFPESCILDKKIANTFTFNNLDRLEGGKHCSKENEATNYFLQFTFKKWFDEFTEKDKAIIKDFIKDYKTQDGKKYIVPNFQRVYVFKRPVKHPLTG
jgi:SAM-dependent methyltransferase